MAYKATSKLASLYYPPRYLGIVHQMSLDYLTLAGSGWAQLQYSAPLHLNINQTTLLIQVEKMYKLIYYVNLNIRIVIENIRFQILHFGGIRNSYVMHGLTQIKILDLEGKLA